jgi:drug/metabolite transporter, DME family
MSPRSTARLQLVGAAALFSTGGAAIKACTLSSVEIAGLRSGIAALALFALVPEARRRWRPRELAVGACYAATLILFVLANKLTSSANAIFLQSTAPIWILLFGPWLLRERITRRDLAYLAVVGVGLACFFVDEQRPSTTASDPVLGNLIALASGLFWALTVTGLRWLSGGERSESAAVVAVVSGNALAFLACVVPIALHVSVGPAPAVEAAIDSHPWTSWALLGYLGVFQIALAYVLVTRALRRLPAFEASVLLLVEPVLNPVWALVFHGERPGTIAFAGGALILLATAYRTWSEPSPVPAPSLD